MTTSAYLKGKAAVFSAAFEKRAFLPMLLHRASIHPWEDAADMIGMDESFGEMQHRRDAMVRRAMDYQASRAAFEKWWEGRQAEEEATQGGALRKSQKPSSISSSGSGGMRSSSRRRKMSSKLSL